MNPAVAVTGLFVALAASSVGVGTMWTSAIGPRQSSVPSACLADGAIEGTPQGDTLKGTTGDDVIFGGGGDDVIRGRGGNDILCGRGGNDTIKGGRGDDTILGGGGDDTLRGGPGNDTLSGGGGHDTLSGGAGTDSCDGEVETDCEEPEPTASPTATPTATPTVTPGTPTPPSTPAPPGKNFPPVGASDSFVVTEDQTLTVPAPGVLGNDTDKDKDTLGAVLETGPANGTLDLRNNGSFTYVPALNFAGGDSFTYTAGDGIAASAPTTVTIDVTPVADAPVAIAQSVSSNEDQAATVTLLATDPDGPVPSVFKVTGLPTDGDLFEGSGLAGHMIVAGELPYTLAGNVVTYKPDPNFDGADDFAFKANDGALDSAAATVDVDLIPINDAPSNVSLSNSSVDEDKPVGTAVGNVLATDPDVGDVHSFSLASGAGDTDNSKFQIENGILKTLQMFDFEAPGDPFSIRVRATDGAGLVFEKVFSVAVNDLNDPPIVGDATFSLPENSANGTAVGSPTGSDPDGGPLTWSITAGNGPGTFAIDSSTGAITVADVDDVDHEDVPQHVLTVTAADNGSPAKTDTGTVTVNVTNVNEAPTDIGLSSASVAENQGSGTAVGNLSAVDPDAGDNHTFSLQSGVGDGDNGKFQIVSGALQTTQGFDFEAPGSPYSVRIRATDANGLQHEEVFSISVTDVNDAPVLTSANTFSIDENSADDSTVGTITATDEDTPAQTLTYSITSGNAAGAFAIDSATGEITVADTSELDYETDASHDLGVQVADSGTPSKNDSDTVTVTLNDLNEAPVVTGATQSLAENSANGTSVATATVTDEDAASTHIWSITGGNTGGAFQINPSTGEITVADTNDLDFETNPTFALVVEATDNGTPGLADTATVDVSLTNVNENPTDIAVNDLTVAENASINTVVGTVSGTDPDAGNSAALVFSKTSGAGDTDNSLFDLGPSNSLRTSAVFDKETKSSYSVRLKATDGGGLTYEETFTVTIDDVNEAPEVGAATFALDENSANGTSVGTATKTDQDAGQTHTWSITGGNTGGAFQIDQNTGAITVADTADVDHETNHPFALTVQATDDGTPPLSDTGTITVNLNDLNDNPVMNAATLSIAENSANGAAVGSATATDEDDPAQTLTYAITGGNAAGGFAINSGTGAITVADTAVLDFENTPSFGLTVQATDNGMPNGSDDASVTVNLTNVNEKPEITAPSTVNAQYGVAKSISGLSVADPDSGNNDITMTLAAPNGVLTLDDGVLNGVVAGDISDNGTAALVIEASQAKINNTLASAGGLTYTSNAGFLGLSDTLAVTTNDGGNTGSGPAQVDAENVTIQFNTPPVATDQTVTTDEDTEKTITLAGTDADPGTTLAFKVTSLPAAGKLHEGTSSAGTLITAGALPYTLPADKVTYVPPLNQNGISLETFGFKANDGSTDSTSAGIVTVDVSAVNDASVAETDPYSVTEDSGATALLVRTNDTDVDGSVELIASVTQPANGTVTKHLGDTRVQYTPNANYCNDPPTIPVDTFTYTLTGGAVGTVNVTVTCADDLPVAVADSKTMDEDSTSAATTTIDVLLNDTDIDGGPKTIVSKTNGTHGTVTITNSGADLKYVPNANYCNTQPGGNPDTFTYDLNGGSGGTVSVTVTCIDDAPVAVNDVATVLEDANATTVNVLANDTDVDGGPKFVDVKSNSTNGGTVTITNSGADLTYAPAANYCNDPELQPAGGSLVETFTYTLNGTPASVGTVTVTVTCVNDPPTADTETFDGADSALSNFRLDNGTSTAGLDIAPATLHNVLAGDVDIEGDTISLVAGADCTGAGPFTCQTDGYDPDGAGGNPVVRGTVHLETDGDFHYTPPPGHVGSDSFDYRVSDGQAQFAEANGTVNITVAGPTTWFVNDDASAGGNGTSASPFQNFTPLTTAGASNHLDDANDGIFVYEGIYTSGIVLENGQRLLGHPHSLDVSDTAGRTHTDLVTGAGAAPAISHLGQTIVTLGSGNELQDLALGNGLVALSGTNVGTATVRDTSINVTNGKALDINGGTMDMVFSTLSSTGSTTEAIKLSNAAGSLTANGGTLSNATNTVVDISGATQDVTIAGNISDSLGQVISIANTTGGTKDFNGTVVANPNSAGSGPRVNLTNNAGSIIRFDNDVILNTVTLPAFNATGGGTLHMGSDDNSLTTTSGTPLTVVNTTIGASDLIFDSISSSGAANGIVLDNTGNTGNLQVTGNPGADTNEGGTIAATTGANADTDGCKKPAGQPAGVGILLKDTNGVVLNDMLIGGSSNFGLLAHDVNGFTMDDTTFNGTHGDDDAEDEGTAHFCDLTGSATISDSVITGAHEDGLKVRNVGGVLDRLTVSNSDFATGTGNKADDAFEASSTGGGTFNVTVNNGSAFTTAAGDHLQYSVAGTGTGNVQVLGNAFSNNYPSALGGGVTINPGGNSSTVNVTYDVSNNTFRDSTIPALTVTTGGTLGATGTYSGTISNNQIGVSGVSGSGAKQNSSGISFHHMGSGTHTVQILNNTIKQYTLSGIRMLANGGNPTVRATVKGNTINEPVVSGDLIGGIAIEMGSSVSTVTSCIDLGSAAQPNVLGSSAPAGTPDVIIFPDGSSTMNLPGYSGAANGAGAASAVASYLLPRNNGGGGTPEFIVNDFGPIQYTGTGTNCL